MIKKTIKKFIFTFINKKTIHSLANISPTKKPISAGIGLMERCIFLKDNKLGDDTLLFISFCDITPYSSHTQSKKNITKNT
jgi:hypothetical protein